MKLTINIKMDHNYHMSINAAIMPQPCFYTGAFHPITAYRAGFVFVTYRCVRIRVLQPDYTVH